LFTRAVYTDGPEGIQSKLQISHVQTEKSCDKMIDGAGSDVTQETEFVAVNPPSTENVVVKIEPMQFIDEVCSLFVCLG
jgi:hypothetical protein